MHGSTELVLGGARSGKSRFAQQAAETSGLPVTLIVTACAADAEMRERIAHHQATRPADWRVVEAPHRLPAALGEHAHAGHAVLVDCVTLWLSLALCDRPESLIDECASLIASVQAAGRAGAALWLVSNEVGWSLVPDHPLGRRFRDEQGRLNQQLAAVCDRVTLVAAGLPLRLKG